MAGMSILRSLSEAIRRRRYAKGGAVPAYRHDPDLIPVLLSPGRSTRVRPGETLLEATERLTEGRDL